MKQETFFKKAQDIYGNKFDLSKVVYTDCKCIITVICPIHGEFTISAQYFLQGKGCIKCNHHDNFIKEASSIHNNRYDYSKVLYEHCNTPVCIICPEHGEFWQTPSRHLNGNGCPKCGKIASAQKNTLTTLEFIKKAREIHGNTYNYSKTIYVNWDTPVCIICPEHGEFWQAPNSHLRGHGCSQCHRRLLQDKRLNNCKDFVEEMINTFGDVIDFSEMDYKNNTTVVTLICKQDGTKFKRTPKAFKKCKVFCKTCLDREKQLTNNKLSINHKQNFIEKLETKYSNRFTLLDELYINQQTKIHLLDNVTNTILYVTPYTILHSKNLLNIPENRVHRFIENANIKHNKKYDYSKVEYANSYTKVCIVCPEHGEFWQTPNDHLKGHGCPKCAKNIKIEKNEYLLKAREIHGDKYDYSNVTLNKQTDNITLVCPIHGEFQVRACHHLTGSGCPKCAGSGGEQILINFFDSKNIQYQYNGFYSWLDKMQLDFYLPQYNIAIEVQGLQHFRDVQIFTPFEEQWTRDEKKRMLCEEHGIKLFYYAPYNYDFPYFVFTNINELWTEMEKYLKIP